MPINPETQVTIAPYGAWRSPLSAQQVAANTLRLDLPHIDDGNLYWIELRPAEAGRSVLVCRDDSGAIRDVTHAPFNVRSRVHEYGGGAYIVDGGEVFFCHDADQRIYRMYPGETPRAITPEGPFRYADLKVDRWHHRLIAVRETHVSPGKMPVNELVVIDLQGGGATTVLASGEDFYASPCLSPDGTQMAWLSWNHPSMPWEGCELWLAGMTPNDGQLREARCIAGSESESVFQPQWSPDGMLYFVSDRSDWWNLYRWRDNQAECIVDARAEFGLPQWVFGMSTYGFESAQRIVCTFCDMGVWRLATIDTVHGQLDVLETAYTDISGLRAAEGQALFLAASPAHPSAIIHWDMKRQAQTILRSSSEVRLNEGYISIAEPVVFPSASGRTAYGFYYPPCNRDFAPPPGKRPPLLVKSHGGPTAATTGVYNPKIQYWTSRGIAVLDVNYGGSTGYGRLYRRQLEGNWGVVDVEDCVSGARYLVARGIVDSERLAISGGSAGGYTTLSALTFHDTFKAGASYYGIGELEALANDTHKFEARYLDGLVGPYPACKERYRQRSPLHHTDRLSCPVIFFQGLEDKVVPPAQAERMVQALRGKHLPVAYLAFADEQHGFRQARNIQRALEAELYFYGRIFGFEPDDDIEPVAIDNLPPRS